MPPPSGPVRCRSVYVRSPRVVAKSPAAERLLELCDASLKIATSRRRSRRIPKHCYEATGFTSQLATSRRLLKHWDASAGIAASPGGLRRLSGYRDRSADLAMRPRLRGVFANFAADPGRSRRISGYCDLSRALRRICGLRDSSREIATARETWRRLRGGSRHIRGLAADPGTSRPRRTARGKAATPPSRPRIPPSSGARAALTCVRISSRAPGE